MDKLISVIVPVYNVERYLDKCVNSIVDQTYKNLEIILVDDGSPDNCPQMCDEWAKKDSRINVIHKQNAGVSAARNDGVRAAKGNFISFVDADDIIQPGMITTLVTYLENNCLDIVSTSYQKFDDINQTQEYPIGENKIFTKKEALLRAIDHWKYHMFSTVWGKVFRSDIAKAINFDRSLIHSEDSKFMFDCILNSDRIGYIDTKNYCYYQNPSGAVSNASRNSKSQLSIILAYNHMYQEIQKMRDDTLIQTAKACMRRTIVERACAVNWTDFQQVRHIVKEFIVDILLEKQNSLKLKIKLLLRYLGIWKNTA